MPTFGPLKDQRLHFEGQRCLENSQEKLQHWNSSCHCTGLSGWTKVRIYQYLPHCALLNVCHLYVLKYSFFYYNVLSYLSGTLSLWHFDRQNEYSNLHEILNTSSWTFCGPITNSENRKSCNTNIFSNHSWGFLEVFGFFYRVL